MSRIRLRLDRLEAGWAVVTVQAEVDTCEIAASFVGGSDSLEGLVHLGTSAMRASPMEVWFESEPGQSRMAIEPVDNDQIELTVHHFADRVRRQPKQLGAPAFAARGSGSEFSRSVRNIFSAWKDNQANYRERWYHPFPARAFCLLEEALAS